MKESIRTNSPMMDEKSITGSETRAEPAGGLKSRKNPRGSEVTRRGGYRVGNEHIDRTKRWRKRKRQKISGVDQSPKATPNHQDTQD